MIRFFDLLLSLIALTLIFPILVPISVLLKCTGEGEVFYLQKRIGQQTREFGVIKFATMLKNSATLGTGTVTIKNDPRVLPVGRFLRKTKINELAQIFNIVKGEMSFIGPRPLTREVFDFYTESQKRTITSVVPGLSGVGSIIFRDEERLLDGLDDPRGFYRDNIAPYKAELEAWYVSNRSAKVYLAALFVTAWVVIRPNSPLVFQVFPTLPKPPPNLVALLVG